MMEYLEYDEYEDDHLHYSPPRMRLQPIDPLLQYADDDFHDRFRMSKNCILVLHADLSDSLDAQRSGSYIISPIIQILVTLRFFADGSFLRSVGDLFNISIASVSRIIHRVSNRICSLKGKYIKFPSQQEIPDAKRGFYDIAQFPGKCTFKYFHTYLPTVHTSSHYLTFFDYCAF